MSVFYNIPQQTNDLASLIQSAGNISNNVSQAIAHISGSTQNDVLYEMVRQKNMRVRSLREKFSQIDDPKIYLTDHIFHAVDLKDRMELFNIKDRTEPFVDSIVILSNNNVMVDNNVNKYIRLWLDSPTSIFVIWDFDNHHWFSLSSMLAACSDMYVPSHADNIEPLSRFNNVVLGPVTCGSIQWGKEFIRSNSELIDTVERSDEPYGTHIEYPQFPYRNKNLKLLSQKMPNVKLVDGSYHGRDMLDRFSEWCSHKIHWIVPVLNDAPIRAFDALITGGIPILPRSLKYHRDIKDLHDHILFYDYEDVQNPLTIAEKGVKIFNERGLDGVLSRNIIALDNHHVDNRVNTILEGVYDEFDIRGNRFWL
jgi:hypothetical protein